MAESLFCVLHTLSMALGPVSYTHLDVYKRQPMSSAAAADFDINLQEEYINDPGDVETVSATFGENGSVTLRCV